MFKIFVFHENLPNKFHKQLGFDKVYSEDIEADDTNIDEIFRKIENWYTNRLDKFTLNYFDFYETSDSVINQNDRKIYFLHHWNYNESDIKNMYENNITLS